MSSDRCMVCGGTVRIISDWDGTILYQPVSAPTEGLGPEHADELEAVVAECEGLRRTVARLSRAVSADAEKVRLAVELAAAVETLLDDTVGASPDMRLRSVASKIGKLHRVWHAWKNAC